MVLFTASASVAQSTQLNIPRDSQRASVTQRVGITDITVKYHRPLVKGRTIWGKVVPYGQVWRAGANENTTITFTDAVSIDGKALEKGTYGLHMIPNQNEWTVIFSRVNTAWGSFTYKESEDALRVNVKPQAAELEEALGYTIEPTEDSATVTMRWEKIAVPFKVSVDVNKIVDASLKDQMRGLPQYTWDGWDDAANYLLAHKVNLEEALEYSNRSIGSEPRYENYNTKSQILEALGKKDEAKIAHDKAIEIATPIQLHQYAFALKGQKKDAEAYAVWKKNFQQHPEFWFTHSGMARVYSAQGDFDNAVKEVKLSLTSAPDSNKSNLENYVKRLQNKEDINR